VKPSKVTLCPILFWSTTVHKKEVDKQNSKMLNEGIIKPSTSPWNAPLWIVPKKASASGEIKWRVVVDYRPLNDITVGDAYPLPNIADILDQLGNSKYFFQRQV
jgi:hypothetical protein